MATGRRLEARGAIAEAAVARRDHLCARGHPVVRRDAGDGVGDFLAVGADVLDGGGADRAGDPRQRLDADPAAGDRAAGDDLFEHTARDRHRDREPDAERAARARVDRGVDADQMAGAVDQRAARVAGVDRGVGLDEVLERRQPEPVAPELLGVFAVVEFVPALPEAFAAFEQLKLF